MYRKAKNIVTIEGILAETELKYGSFQKNGQTVESIGGMIKVAVDQEINKVMTHLEIPVHMFSTKYTKNGGLNPAYTAIEKVMNEFTSIAAAGGVEGATKVRITGGNLTINNFVGRDGNVVSAPRINANFVSLATGSFNMGATFSIEGMVRNLSRATDKEGIELTPPKLNIGFAVPQYTAETANALNVDTFKLVAINPKVIAGIEGAWEAGKCYAAQGVLNFSSRTEEVYTEVDFGEPQKKTRTISVSELVITGGTETPLEEEYSWTIDEIKAGVLARQAYLDELKSKPKADAPKAPAATGKVDLGF